MVSPTTLNEQRTTDIAVAGGSSETVDLDLHGIVGLRLIDAAPGDHRAVARQLNPHRTTLDREPDITIRFVERLETRSPVRLIGAGDAGFTDDAFLLLPDGRRRTARTQIALGAVGGPCEIVCESGVSEVPLLASIVSLTALVKGFAPVHASACLVGETGVLATGWTAGGKTGLLMTLMSRGARFLSDDVVYVSPDGGEMFGLRQDIHLKDGYLAQLPQYRPALPRRDMARMRLARLIESAGAVVPSAIARRIGTARLRRRLARLLRNQRAAHVDPHRLFGRESCVPSGPLDKILFVLSHDRPDLTVERADPREIARRMAFSSLHELLELRSCYLKYRFAFPDRANSAIERAGETLCDVLPRAMEGKQAYVVCHPYPASIPQLYEALRPVLE